MVFTYTAPVRYLEVDQQGVVFNMWYLGYLDEACTGFLCRTGATFQDLLDAGADLQLVHTELDWVGSLRFGDTVHIDVAAGRLGNTSFTLEFAVHTGNRAEPVATARTVYVVIDPNGSGKRRPPQLLLDVLAAADG